MKKEIAEKWCAALRSGKYTQCQGQLKDDNGAYCCLGVLEQLAVDEGIIGRVSGVVPSSKTREWSGLEHGSGYYSADEPDLMTRNDALGQSFTQIADIIEQNVEAL